MKTISQAIVAGGRKSLGPLRTLGVQSLSGEAYAVFDGEQVTLSEGQVYELPVGERFENVEVFAAAGSHAVIVYGSISLRALGSTTVTSTGATTMQVYTDAYADPNGNVAPDDTAAAAVYYQNTSPAPSFWVWHVAGSAWVQIV